MNLPPYGFCCPCRFVRLLEPDRILVRVATGHTLAETEAWTIHLSAVAALAPPDTPQGGAAADFVEQLLDDFGDSLAVFIPDSQAVLSRYSRGRHFEGEIFLGTDQRLSGSMIQAGHGLAPHHVTQDGKEP